MFALSYNVEHFDKSISDKRFCLYAGLCCVNKEVGSISNYLSFMLTVANQS